jgi:hypothetical protein
MAPPLDATRRPIAIIVAPKITVAFAPNRSAAGPMINPPKAMPSHDSEAHSETTDRALSSSDDICRSATMAMNGAPKVTDMMPSAALAATHEARLSMLVGGATPLSSAGIVALAAMSLVIGTECTSAPGLTMIDGLTPGVRIDRSSPCR